MQFLSDLSAFSHAYVILYREHVINLFPAQQDKITMIYDLCFDPNVVYLDISWSIAQINPVVNNILTLFTMNIDFIASNITFYNQTRPVFIDVVTFKLLRAVK